MRVSKFIKIALGVLAGASLLTLVGPVLGETVATLPPVFPQGEIDPLIQSGLSFQEVAFPTSDGLMLRGWFIPADGGDSPAIIYAPATRNDQRSGLSLAPIFHRAGYHVLLFSYRGHALSDGNRWEFTYGHTESQDIDAAVRFLWTDKGIRSVGVVGHSAGAVSAILSAARNPAIGAVAAVAPYGCVTEVWRTSSPSWVPGFVLDWTLRVVEKSRGFSREQACPASVVEQIAPRPLLLIHGTADRRITEAQARQLFDAAGRPKSLWLVEGAGHGEIRDPVLDVIAPDVIAFFDDVFRGQAYVLAPASSETAGRGTGLQ